MVTTLVLVDRYPPPPHQHWMVSGCVFGWLSTNGLLNQCSAKRDNHSSHHHCQESRTRGGGGGGGACRVVWSGGRAFSRVSFTKFEIFEDGGRDDGIYADFL
jgi:hypothetical protein